MRYVTFIVYLATFDCCKSQLDQRKMKENASSIKINGNRSVENIDQLYFEHFRLILSANTRLSVIELAFFNKPAL